MSAKHNTRKAPNVDDKTGTNGKPAVICALSIALPEQIMVC